MTTETITLPLRPYEPLTDLKKSSLTGTVHRKKNSLTLEFHLTGELDTLLIPPLNQDTQRLDQLWEHTCFEAFLTWNENSSYWEFNFSPEGHWNVYRFEDYRQGQIQEEGIKKIEYEVTQSTHHSYKNRITIDLSDFIPPLALQAKLSLSLTAVIEEKDHSKTYWATQHAGSKPDFHLRNSFFIRI